MAVARMDGKWNFLLTSDGKKDKIIPLPIAAQAQLAQLVEQRTENPRVSGSIPELGIVIFYDVCGCSSMVEH